MAQRQRNGDGRRARKRAFVPIYGNSGVGMPGTDGNTLVVIELGDRKVIHIIGRPDNFMPSSASLGDGCNLPPGIRVNQTESLVSFIGDQQQAGR